MGFAVEYSGDAINVTLSGWDRAANWRRQVSAGYDEIERVTVAARNDLENLIDHRALGIGYHNGVTHPNKRRVGTMMGRGVLGNQFWAVGAGQGSTLLLVLDVRDDRPDQKFRRLVVEVDDPERACARIEGRRSAPG